MQHHAAIFCTALLAAALLLMVAAHAADAAGNKHAAKWLGALACGLAVAVPLILALAAAADAERLGSAPVAYRSNFTVTGACAKASEAP